MRKHPGISSAVLYCALTFLQGYLGTCANNCRGVDPNSVIIGGGAVLAASAVGGLSFFGLAPALGLGAVAAAAGGMALTQCPASRPCRVFSTIFDISKV